MSMNQTFAVISLDQMNHVVGGTALDDLNKACPKNKPEAWETDACKAADAKYVGVVDRFVRHQDSLAKKQTSR